MDCSMPSFPVHHLLTELAQIHVHQVSDAIQPCHPLLSPSPPALSLSRIMVFSNESAICIRWSKYWSFSFNISPSNIQDWFPLDRLARSPGCPRDSQESSLKPQFKSINSSALSFLYSPALTPMCDHWRSLKKVQLTWNQTCSWQHCNLGI